MEVRRGWGLGCRSLWNWRLLDLQAQRARPRAKLSKLPRSGNWTARGMGIGLAGSRADSLPSTAPKCNPRRTIFGGVSLPKYRTLMSTHPNLSRQNLYPPIVQRPGQRKNRQDNYIGGKEPVAYLSGVFEYFSSSYNSRFRTRNIDHFPDSNH
ncbi:hypothetical protein VTK26DRAFT_5084 [Humicola hyalothermophila]